MCLLSCLICSDGVLHRHFHLWLIRPFLSILLVYWIGWSICPWQPVRMVRHSYPCAWSIEPVFLVLLVYAMVWSEQPVIMVGPTSPLGIIDIYIYGDLFRMTCYSGWFYQISWYYWYVQNDLSKWLILPVLLVLLVCLEWPVKMVDSTSSPGIIGMFRVTCQNGWFYQFSWYYWYV